MFDPVLQKIIPFLIGIAGIAVTVALHSFATSQIVWLLKKYGPTARKRFGNSYRPMILGVVACCLAIKHYGDIIFWAMGYWFFCPQYFDGFESALYYSSVTYTTLGYGDIVLTGPWRLLSGIQAMNGILLFGWSTAMLFFMVQRMWSAEINEFEKRHVKRD